MNMSNHIPGYLAAIAATIAVCAAAVFAVNFAVDPMWYFGGNKLGTVNYAFNERLSKTNLFLANRDKYDCVIFGDSRVTLLPQNEIEGHTCFNFAFSAGKAEEAVAYARYLSSRGFKPDLVIMGVPGAAFRERIGGTDIPSFIREQTEPKSAYLNYLSFDALSMSKQTLFGESPLDRIYTRNFVCRVAPGAPEYDPAVPVRDLMAGRFTGTFRVKFYDEMRDAFPEAELVGYVPPISAWAIDAYAKAGWLDDYVKALHLASEKFDRFIDNGVPSSMTMDTGNTYDGTHYSEPANSIVAASLLKSEQDEALDVKRLTASQMMNIYRERLERFRPEIEAGLAD